jgi:ribosomal protein S18 acetylase RimI-like enzyme
VNPVTKIRVVNFSKDDLAFGKHLTDVEGWGRSVSEWLKLLELEPDGLFKATLNGRNAGTAGVLNYGRIAWVHSVIVEKGFRNLGVATELMRTCTRYAKSRGVDCVRLDAIPGTERFYEKLGFRPEHQSLRLEAKGPCRGGKAERIRPDELDDVCLYDFNMTHLRRDRVIRQIYFENQEWAHLLRDSGKIKGFIIARDRGETVEIGPCVADPEDRVYASELLETVLKAGVQRRFRLCVDADNQGAVALLKQMGFEEYAAPRTRMSAGNFFEDSKAIFSMISPTKG